MYKLQELVGKYLKSEKEDHVKVHAQEDCFGHV